MVIFFRPSVVVYWGPDKSLDATKTLSTLSRADSPFNDYRPTPRT